MNKNGIKRSKTVITLFAFGKSCLFCKTNVVQVLKNTIKLNIMHKKHVQVTFFSQIQKEKVRNAILHNENGVWLGIFFFHSHFHNVSRYTFLYFHYSLWRFSLDSHYFWFWGEIWLSFLCFILSSFMFALLNTVSFVNTVPHVRELNLKCLCIMHKYERNTKKTQNRYYLR